jgi:flagellar hook-associated protein 1 FlgK
VSARDGALSTALSSLDGFAFDLGNSLNTVQTSGFDLNGNAGQPLFVVGGTAPGTAASIGVSAAISGTPSLLAAASTAAGGSGDATNLQAMIATASTALPTSGADPVGTLANLTSTYGASAQSAQNTQTQTTAILTNLQNLRSSTSGVSTQAELTTLDQAQAVYTAIGKVISTTDAMLNSLLQIQ